uniref:Transmembrane protein n=1 Tax=Pyramimonas obovata TaxID=1411642 RepID=A0A6T7WIQ3_9CHLO|mmetsp:Transcript_28993/g.63427  ORF Transcript_28993/g.63427 Transcript_28993/m.63427 type:complete len:452 (+) Transcript_28993:169-1524(+)|eukprot:CAMPEP_0118922088 /NCGR_PEP_ID=MMETSP1169-20130426/1136_1 /TAXON_ID=36882 /ORGANISM="Pyramimonas obovata, Strain CCMP722" /LENGTH=451 /DNA_ID=CAMNT_0006862909 /DNA_START=156 /DNA_END=1511 /DNA_ORIENTATION=+
MSSATSITVVMPYVAITLLVVFCTNFRWSLSTAMLKDLIIYKVPTKEQVAEQRRKEHEKANKLSQRKKSAKRTDDEPEEQLMLIPTSAEGLLSRAFFTDFDKLVFLVSVVVANLLLGQALYLIQTEKRAQDGGAVLTCFAIVAVITATFSLFSTQYNRFLTPQIERSMTYLVGGASFLCALLVLVSIPTEILDFELEEASAAVSLSMKRNVLGRFGIVDGTAEVPVAVLQLILPIFAGFLGGAATAPAVRAVRCYALANSPPDWSEGHLSRGFFVKAAFHLNMVVPLAVVVLWVRPLVEEPLELSPDLVVTLRAGACMLAGLLMLGMLRPQVQTFLDNGMVVWYECIYGSATTSSAEKEKLSTNVRLHLELNSTLLCKVALQMLGPAVILVSFATLIWHKGVMTQYLNTDFSFVPPILVKGTASFLAWWFCCVWTVISYVTLGMFRYGKLM